MNPVWPVAGPARGLSRNFGSWSARLKWPPVGPFGRGVRVKLKGRPMNPADIAQSVAPLTSSNLSLFHLFWHAH